MLHFSIGIHKIFYFYSVNSFGSKYMLGKTHYKKNRTKYPKHGFHLLNLGSAG